MGATRKVAHLLAMEEPAEKRARLLAPADNGSHAFTLDLLYLKKYTITCAGELINAVKISADKTKLATCSSKGLIRVYEFESGKEIVTLSGHTKGVSDIVFSPVDSNTIASGSDDLTIRLWSISKAKCIRILKKHTYHITTVLFNSKGNLLISGAADETIVIWDLATARSLKTLSAHSDPVSSICLTPDDTVVVSASHDGLMRLFDTETGQCLKTLIYNSTSHGTATASTKDVVNFPISNVVVSPNGKYILSSALDGKIRLWDYMNNKVVKTYTNFKGTAVSNKYDSGAAFITQTQQPVVVSGSDSSGLLFWHLQTKEVVFQLQAGSTVLGVESYDGGSFLASCTLSGEVNVYQLNEEQKAANAQLRYPVESHPHSPSDSSHITPAETPVETPTEERAETPAEALGEPLTQPILAESGERDEEMSSATPRVETPNGQQEEANGTSEN